jgi:hypothetical protein
MRIHGGGLQSKPAIELAVPRYRRGISNSSPCMIGVTKAACLNVRYRPGSPPAL